MPFTLNNLSFRSNYSARSANSPLQRDDCMDAGGRATQEQLPRGLGERN